MANRQDLIGGFNFSQVITSADLANGLASTPAGEDLRFIRLDTPNDGDIITDALVYVYKPPATLVTARIGLGRNGATNDFIDVAVAIQEPEDPFVAEYNTGSAFNDGTTDNVVNGYVWSGGADNRFWLFADNFTSTWATAPDLEFLVLARILRPSAYIPK